MDSKPLLRQSDFIILTIALTDETWHMLNKETFRQVKPGAFLVNMARGGLVCTEDLIEASKASTGNIAVHKEELDLTIEARNVELGQIYDKEKKTHKCKMERMKIEN